MIRKIVANAFDIGFCKVYFLEFFEDTINTYIQIWYIHMYVAHYQEASVLLVLNKDGIWSAE